MYADSKLTLRGSQNKASNTLATNAVFNKAELWTFTPAMCAFIYRDEKKSSLEYRIKSAFYCEEMIISVTLFTERNKCLGICFGDFGVETVYVTVSVKSYI